jgi:TPR repeat protein
MRKFTVGKRDQEIVTNLRRFVIGFGLGLMLVGQPLNAQQSEADRQMLAELRAGAEGGNAEFQSQFGLALLWGKHGLARNPAEAVKWLRKAAGQNFAVAQSNLGVCYERRDGVPKYEVEAYKWDLLAAVQGDTRAKRNLSLLELLLSPEEIAEGKQRMQAWLEQHTKLSTGK